MRRASWVMFAAVVLAASGCTEEVSATPDAGEVSPFHAQAEQGGALFGAHCAHCHGADGRGTEEAPPLVGLDEGALPLEPRSAEAVRQTQFVTVGDIAAFASVNMPADDPGSLETDQYYAILAFALFANGIELEEELTPALAEELVIPR